MVKIIYHIFITSIFLFICNCKSFQNNDIIGVYSAPKYNKIIDTFFIYENGLFERKIFNKSNPKINIKYSGVWYIEDGFALHISPHYYNYDDEISLEEINKYDTSGAITMRILNKENTISFYTYIEDSDDYFDEGKHFYYKIK